MIEKIVFLDTSAPYLKHAGKGLKNHFQTKSFYTFVIRTSSRQTVLIPEKKGGWKTTNYELN